MFSAPTMVVMCTTGSIHAERGHCSRCCPSSRELVMHETVLGVVHHFLHHVTAVQLHLTQLISIEPGETAQKLHRDQMAFDFFPFPPEYHVQCNTMWALTDFTAENGATHIVPGSSGVSDARPRHPRVSGRNAARKCAVLRRQGRARGRREPATARPARCEHHLRRRVGPPGGEPVPCLPTEVAARSMTICCG